MLRPMNSATQQEPRRWIYAAFNLLFAALYLSLTLFVAPSRSASGQLVAVALIVGASGSALGMLLGEVRGWWLAAVSCGLLLLTELIFLVMLLWSAAFLSGVYGAFGRGAAVLTLVVAFLSIQLVGLLPAMQLKFLMTRRGRAVFGLEPHR